MDTEVTFKHFMNAQPEKPSSPSTADVDINKRLQRLELAVQGLTENQTEMSSLLHIFF